VGMAERRQNPAQEAEGRLNPAGCLQPSTLRQGKGRPQQLAASTVGGG